MGINNYKKKFYASSIVGGVIPIALGIAVGLREKNQTQSVGFIGDMAFETGVFHEVYICKKF